MTTTQPAALAAETTTGAPHCHGAPMAPEIGFCSGRLFHRCHQCRRTDYGWWDPRRTLTEGNQP